MKKKLNIIFFSICFLAAVITEAYFIRADQGNLLNVASIGLVVLITGYLLFDSIRSKLVQSMKDIRFYLDQYLREDTYRWDERFTETNNLWKATYTATKKNSAMLREQLDSVLQRIDKLEENTTGALQTISELQKKFLEGQKNALNYEINHNRENTKQIIKALHEESNRTDSDELWDKLLSSLNKNNELLETQISKLNKLLSEQTYQKPAFLDNTLPQEFHEDFYEDAISANLIESEIKNESKVNEGDAWNLGMISGIDSLGDIDWSSDEEENTPDVSLEELEEPIPEVMELNYEEDVLPSVEPVVEPIIESSPTITPLYDDPNKQLSPDEIAALFASFGK